MVKRRSDSKDAKGGAEPDGPLDVAASAFADALRKKELVARVANRARVRKGEAKPIIEAALAELGETLAEGRPMILPPLGRIKVTRKAAQDHGQVLVLRLRQPRADRGGDLSGVVPEPKS